MNIHLLTIDPQVDFCSPPTSNIPGALYVPGAEKDIERLSQMVDRLGNKISKITVTLDSHRTIDVAHSVFWIDSEGNHPAPFTIISLDDVQNGVWRCSMPSFQSRMLDYVKALHDNKRYPLCIWPTHCVIGTFGHAIMPEFSKAICKWEEQNKKLVNYVTKGSNPFTEHYSAVKADVEDPQDETTKVNGKFISAIADADKILITGQALSHCVSNTINDIYEELGEEVVKKFVLLKDTSSNVPGFEQYGNDFIDKFSKLGMEIVNSDEFLK